MSWFFGKKKHRESPPDSPKEETRPSDDEFIFIERRNQPEADSDDKPSALYPSLDNMSTYPTMPPLFPKQNSQENTGNYLSDIPFKLCKELERSMNNDLVIDQLRLDEIVSFMERINIEDYDYEFSLEQNTITEINSQNEE